MKTKCHTLYCEKCCDWTVWESDDGCIFECTECDEFIINTIS